MPSAMRRARRLSEAQVAALQAQLAERDAALDQAQAAIAAGAGRPSVDA